MPMSSGKVGNATILKVVFGNTGRWIFHEALRVRIVFFTAIHSV
jgi:hypothetical protein